MNLPGLNKASGPGSWSVLISPKSRLKIKMRKAEHFTVQSNLEGSDYELHKPDPKHFS